MLQVKDNGSKRAIICGVDYVLNSMATVKDYPGSIIMVLVSEWIPIRFSSASFTESDDTNGEMVSQELSIELKGMDPNSEKDIREIIGQAVLIRLKYNSGVYKLVGTEENPVILSHHTNTSATSLNLVSKRNSAEKAKYLYL
jgi:hypothetical protein